MNELINLPVPQNALEVFTCDKAEAVVSAIEEHARSVVPDLSSVKGRKAIASNAAAVARSKVALDNLGKELVSEWKTKAKAVDNERKMMRDRLSLLRDEVRQPLTEWEEADRIRAIEQAKALKLIEDHSEALEMNVMFDREREFARRDAELKAREHALAEAQKAEIAELEKRKADELAAAEEERKEIERQARIEKEKAEAVEKAKADAEQAVRDAEEAQARAERESIEAKAREKANAEFAEKREREAAEVARQAELARQESERKAKADAEAKREANTRHVGKIRREALDDLIAMKVSEDLAVKIVKAIHAGKIRNITITY